MGKKNNEKTVTENVAGAGFGLVGVVACLPFRIAAQAINIIPERARKTAAATCVIMVGTSFGSDFVDEVYANERRPIPALADCLGDRVVKTAQNTVNLLKFGDLKGEEALEATLEASAP